MKNIYSKNIAGFVLDQTQPRIRIKTRGTNIVFEHILKAMAGIQVIDQKYGITLTFNKRFHRDDPNYLHKLTKLFFVKYNQDFKYIIFSEFTKKGILHFHGVIWNCYQLPFIKMANAWTKRYGYVKKELNIRHYFCGTINNCSIKKAMLKSKEESKCWMHYIMKDYQINGLSTINNY